MKKLMSMDVVEAELMASRLQARGLWSFVQKDDGGGMRPSLSFVSGARVMVREEDFETAKALVAEWQEQSSCEECSP